MMILRTTNKNNRRHAFTLIELIVVMGLLAVMMAVAAPRLSGFFSGRGVKEETRRFLSVTRFARSEAISNSAVMRLWVNEQSGTYGLEPHNGYEREDWQTIEIQLPDTLKFVVDDEVEQDNEGQVQILFQPDGVIDSESLQSLRIEKNEEMGYDIGLDKTGASYEVKDENELEMSQY